ncbi:MAG: transglycosylase domain-containing protein [Nitrospirota bacterium]|nr:transglycosylase domain-containing protein [Nitrospirota bacterium]MDH5699579.1 transglycosylase domain-containing protein [Nitrospirota bacterium]
MALLGLYVLFEILTFPFLSIARLPTVNPTETALMRQRIEEAHEPGKTMKIDYRWTSLSNVPRHVRMAVLVSEDGTFYSHAGVDWHEVWESVETNWEEGRIVRGGSTITQQLSKNLYLSIFATQLTAKSAISPHCGNTPQKSSGLGSPETMIDAFSIEEIPLVFSNSCGVLCWISSP